MALCPFVETLVHSQAVGAMITSDGVCLCIWIYLLALMSKTSKKCWHVSNELWL